MILHLLEDDKNIIKRTVSMYEKLAPEGNEYWVEDAGKHVFSYLEKQDLVKRLSFDNLMDKIVLSKYRAIIFHALSPSKISFLCQLPKRTNIKLVWILWGADMYNHISLKGYKLLNYKPSIFNIKDRMLFYGNWKGIIPERLKKITKNNNPILANFETAISKLDIICAYQEDFSLLKKYFPTISAECLFYNYYPIELSLGTNLVNRQVIGNNILVGNSASKENNHYSAFRTIKNIKHTGRIIVPLSYGDSSYGKFVVKKGYKTLGNNFMPLVDFLPIDEYYKLLLSCGIVIMPHLRQQAIGNIIVPLYLGAKVFLYEENPLYLFFTKIGMTVFSINKMTNSDKEFELLDQNTISKNREIIEKYFSTEATERYIFTLIQTINKE